MDFWTEYYKNQEEERKRLLGLSTTPKRKTADELLAESLKPTLDTDWTPYTQGKSPMYPGAPEGAWLPTTLADAFNEVVKSSEFPDETEARLNSAYLLSQTYNIPIETAIRDFEPITSALYKKTLAPQTAFQAIKTTWQAAQIGTRIADISNQLWNKGKDWDFEKDPLWQEMMQLQAMMPVQDEIKRSLPVEALKDLMQFVPSQMESMKAGALGGLAGAGAGALIAGMLVPGMQIPLIGITALGGLSMLTAQASVIGLGRTMGTMAQTAERSRQLETGSAFYSFISYQDPITGAKLNPQIAWEWAGIYGSLAGAVETIGVETFLSKLTPDIGKSAANLLKKRAADILTDPKQQVARAGIVQRHFLGWAGDAVKYAWEHGGDIIAETTEEALQDALQILSQETAKKLTEDTDSVQFTYMTRQQVASQIAETAWGAFLGTSAMAGIRGGVKLFTATPGATTKLSSEIQSTKNATREEALSSQAYEVFKQQINQPLPKGLTFGRTEQVAGERYTYKIGDSKKKRLESATVDIAPSQNENEPGTVNIIGFEKESDPKIAQALVTKIAQTFPGWRIDISEQTPFSQALTRYMSERNPKGPNLGINPYPTYRAIPEQASMKAVEEAIRSVKPTWTEEELRLSTRWLTGLAPQIGMTPDELAKKTFHPVVAVGFAPENPSKTFGASSQVEYEKGIKSLISLGPNANATTVLHETVHTTLWYLQANRNIPQIAMFLDEAERVFKIKNRDWRADWEGWTAEYEKTAGANPNRSGEEALAYALEDYLAFGKVQEDQEGILAKLAKMVVELYNGLKAARVTLTPEVTAFFDKIMTDSPVAQEMQLETETEAIGIATEPLGTTQEPEVEKNYQEPPEDAPAVQQQQQEKDPTGANNELDIFQGQRDQNYAQNTLALQEAKKMASEGRTPEEIKNETGWTQVRGQWMHDPLFQGGYNTPAFKEWFGDSKVIDERGAPKAVYKGMYPYDWTNPGSKNPIQEINRKTLFPAFNGDEEGVKIAGFFGDKETANRFSSNINGSAIFPAYLKMEEPFEIDANGKMAGEVQFGPEGEAFREAIKSGKYDGIIIKNTSDEGTIYVALKPEQIKSVYNRGTWSPDDARILFQGQREERILDGEEYETAHPVWISNVEEALAQEAAAESESQDAYLFQGFGGPSSEGGYNAGAAIQELLKNKAGIVERAAYVEGIGDIAFPWGWEGSEDKNYENGYGLAKILKKHEESDSILAEIGEVLRLGKVTQDPRRAERKWVVYKNIKAVIALDRHGEPGAWLVTAYIPETWRNKNSPSTGLTSIAPQATQAQESGPQVSTDSPTVPRKRMVVKVVRRPNNPDDLKKLYQGIAVKHGSGAGFSKFNLAFVGTGEGAQAYGYGLYFTENPKIAKEHYADRLGTNAGLRTTFGDMSPDDMSQVVEAWAGIVDDETEDGPMVEFADFLQTRTGQNAAEAAMGEFMQELKRRLTALGDKALFMGSERLEELANVAMTGTDDPDDAADLEKLNKYQAIIKNEIRETKNTLRPKFEYEASFDEKKEYFPDILDMIVDTALDADMVTAYGGRFIYDAELELRGDNPGDEMPKPRWEHKPGDKIVVLGTQALRDGTAVIEGEQGILNASNLPKTKYRSGGKDIGELAIEWLFKDKLLKNKKYELPVINSNETDPKVIARAEEKTTKVVKEALSLLMAANRGCPAFDGYRAIRDFLFGPDQKGKIRLVPSYAYEKKFDYDAPLRNTLIRWEKPLYDDQIAALYRYFEKQKKEATDEGLEEMAEAWERISSILVHMEEGDNTGKGLYNYLTNEFDSWGWTSRNNEEYDEGEGEKITSDLLYRAGFDGIQYPVAYLSGVRGDKGWNYVMFDDSAITITKRTLYQGEAQNPDLVNQTAIEMIGEGQSFDDFVSFLESGLVDDSWGIPDIEPGAKKEWYRKKWDEALTPEAAAPAVATWVKSLAQDEYKGIRGMLQIIWDEVIQKENEKPYPGADPEEILELQAQQERAYQIRQDIAESIVAGALAVGSKDKPLSKHFMASLYGTIKENPGSYARIYGELTGNETLMAAGQTEEAAQFAEIEDPPIASTMTISQKKAYADQISNEKIAKAVRSGEYNDAPEIVKYVKALQKENAESKKQLETLNKEIKEADVTIDYQAKAIGRLRGDSRKTNREIDAIQKRISDYLDAGITIPPALESRRKSLTAKRDKIRQDLVAAADWVEINRQIEESKRKILNAEREMASANEKGETNWDAVNTRSTEQENIRKLEARVAEGKSFRDSAAVQTYLAKLEERAALEEKYAKKEGEQKALRIIREHRAKLLKQIKRPAAKNANVKYKSAITSIQKILNLKYPADQIDSARSVAMALIGKIAAEPSLADLAPSADLEKIIGKTPAKISTADLERIYSIIMALRKTGREVQSAIDERIAQENSLRRGRIGDVLESLPGYKRPTGTDTTVNENKTLINRIRQLDYAFKNAYRQLRDMDGGVDGENVEFAWTRMNRLWREKEINANRRKNAILSAIRDLGGDPKDWYDEVITVPGAGKENGDAVLRKTDLMAMALGFRNEDSRQAILYGKFFSEGEKREWKKLALQNKELAWGVAEAEGERKFYLLNEAINDALSEHDWSIINTVFEKDGIETAPRLTQKVAEATGEEMVVVDHYFPLLRKGVGEQQLAQQQADEVNMRTRGLRRPPANGFTKARIKISPWHQRDVDTDLLGLWLKSIDRQEQYISFVMYGKELDAVYQDQLVQEQIKGKFGMAGVEFIQDYINEVKNPSEYSKGTAADTAIKFMRGNLGAAYLGFRVASVLKQVITSPWPALPYAGPRIFAEAVKMMGNPVKYLRETEELSIFLQSRSFDVIQATVKNADVHSKLGKRIKNAELLGMKGMEYADRFSVAIGWRAVFEKALEETGDTQKAIEKADQMVMQTQPTGRGVDLAPAYRGKSAAVQIVLQFTQALNVVYQQLRFDIPAAIKNHDLKTALGIATGAMIAGTLLQAMTSRPPEEPEDPKKAAARWIFYALSQGTDSLPLIGEQATMIMKRAITGETSYKMVDEAMPAIAEFMDGMYSLAGQDWQKGLETMAQSFGSFAGMPVSGMKGAGRILSGDFGTLIGRPRKER